MSNFIKILPVAFSQFCERAKKSVGHIL